jgi:hypothetical protein
MERFALRKSLQLILFKPVHRLVKARSRTLLALAATTTTTNSNNKTD